ncbi:N(5)-glutamine methyltransferase MTQ2 [Nannizzia gypsea CBS 118893]|uniref:N(5)-glutamine methyltransferase MTQ2 n=1 Tax=Arthroderma gypseum (strain ATCC MYA-4604 / CBS 118893) TaxID=535722 RepID=E4UPF1_ARTGP|nr:N(5)-glutamine methyltransferase MTQ2 [Nannizzia gypsea CBS 118893]EFQ99040.1 N(5)-glutamine methyltransferase MTQ2 [Nannizzia gypsea CBS 118893]
MLPTPSTSHVAFDTIYEPAEDSYLFLDTLSDLEESIWLSERFSLEQPGQRNGPLPTSASSPSPVIVEVGTGSGVILGFLAANCKTIIGRSDILTIGTDVNRNACSATRQTVKVAIADKYAEESFGAAPANKQEANTKASTPIQPLAVITGDLCSSLRPGMVDILLFNPPYVPTPELPHLPSPSEATSSTSGMSRFEMESYLLSLTYAGGEHGMETTNRLLDSIPQILNPERGVAYVLLCAQNKPQEVMGRINGWGNGWKTEIAGRSGVKAGWERLVIIRIWRD